ncbi:MULTISPECIES: response regulator transcription factor [unclassified Nocardiopsis]|uniref:response regulator n=1 Tax=unclassified Nocardiopsis TaxID=2649073 RepID=UPI00066B2DE9|nr:MULTISPECIES: response regulator transcription factor [unclassified Nocardiopsis]MBQ1081680.1 response regulator transcription factor [Nocardiopsis sp. B62]
MIDTRRDPVRVLIADDQELLRGSLRMLVDNDPGMTVVAEAGTGREALDLVAHTAPDLVLMDVRMPDLDGLTATRHICANSDTTRVIVLTMFDLDEYVYGALRAGASGFLLKNTRPEELLRALRLVADGQALLAPEVTGRLIADVVRSGGPRLEAAPWRVDASGLTPREREVVTLIGRGLSNTEIAGELTLSHSTVKTYVSRLLAKLDARDRAQLVVFAYESGLVRVA